MSSQLLVLSERQNDLEFWQKISASEGLKFKSSVETDEILRTLREDPDSLILWDGQCEQLKGLDQVFLDLGVSSNVFVVTDGPARSYPYLFLPPVFHHHLYRRYDEFAEFLCAQLIRQHDRHGKKGFDQYFRGPVSRHKITLTRSEQKLEAVEIFRDFMISQGVLDRIAHVGADAADELMMNAIFDAPRDAQGRHYRRPVARDASFELVGREQVEAEVLISQQLIGIRVLDQFGSLDPEATLRCLGKNFADGYTVDLSEPGAGIGISKLIKSALSLAFNVNPGVSTESIALIGNSPNFRTLRQSFSFFSIQAGRS